MLGLLILLGVIILFIVIYVFYEKSYELKINNAEKSGIAYKMLLEINKKYNLKEYRYYDLMYRRCTNPQKYKSKIFAFSCFVKEVVQPKISFFEKMLEDIVYNKRLYPQYIQEFNRLLLCAKNSAERNLCEQQKEKPLLEATFTIELFYKYFNQYMSEKYTFDELDIQKAIIEAKNIDISKTNEQKERTLMSDSLRFQILKRDNYTCQICGKKASDGVELEIDHIIPISKGGRTVPNNLQTLCKRCNRGKRDNIM